MFPQIPTYFEKFIANPSANLSAALAEFKLPDNRNLLIAYASEPDKYRNLVEALKYKQSKNPAVLKALDDFLANPTDKKLLKNILSPPQSKSCFKISVHVSAIFSS